MMPEGNFSEILVAGIIKDLQSALEELQAITSDLAQPPGGLLEGASDD